MRHISLRQNLTFRNLFLFLLLVIVVSLPLSKYLASAAQILLIAVWLAEGKFGEKWRRIKSSPQILIFTLLFFIPLLGMLYTADLGFGFGDLKIKLPLFLLPIVMGSVKPLNDHEMKLVSGGFVIAVMAGALVSLSIMLGIGPLEYTNDRETVRFISHIRFALMTVMAVFILFYYAFDSKTVVTWRIALTGMALCLILFLFLLKSLTGIVILILGGMLLALRWGLRQKDLLVRWFIIVGFATVPVLSGVYLTGRIAGFYTIRENPGELDRQTARGNPYWHDMDNQMIENGYYVGWYQCETELREGWSQISRLDYDGPDHKGQELKYTLIRYLTSMGLRKDAHGVSQLKPEDIRMIENGFANCLYKHPGRFGVRIYETIWEFDQYRKGANPSGHSVTQRLEYLKTGWAIFLDHPVFGVGTGDTRMAFDQKYEEMQSPLDPAWRLRAHNQFLTFLISFGFVGFLLLMAAMVIPVMVQKRKDPYFIIMLLLVTLLSMLNEDTLETQAGVAFFATFYCLFVFADGREKSIS